MMAILAHVEISRSTPRLQCDERFSTTKQTGLVVKHNRCHRPILGPSASCRFRAKSLRSTVFRARCVKISSACHQNNASPSSAKFSESALKFRARLRVFPTFCLSQAMGRVQPRRRRFFQRWLGRKMPSGVIMPVMRSGGVTSKPGLRARLPGLATRT
jgi:hypothetical protein